MMSRAEQIQFVHDLTFDITKDVLEKIKDGKIPEGWTGVQLRQYIAEKFKRSMGAMNKSQQQEYDNDVLVRGL